MLKASEPDSGSDALDAYQCSVTEPLEIALLLIVGSEPPDRHGGTPHMSVDGEEKSVVPTAVSKCFECQYRCQSVCALTPVFHGKGHPLDPEGCTSVPKLT